MVKCVDCGICGFNLDLGGGLRWREMDRPVRRAFVEGTEYNPAGQNPGTAHWNHARCAKYLQEWAEWADAAPSSIALRETLTSDRQCDGFDEYRAGLSPQEHPSFRQPEVSTTSEPVEYDVFLSHSHENDDLAQSVQKLLESSGIRTFATPSSTPSGLWSPQIEAALRQSHELWLILTPAALDRSIWAHQEFGYFYGFKRAMDSDNADQRLHYFEIEGNRRRPGMYSHFQGTSVRSLDDPVTLARAIAGSLGKAFNEPEDPAAWIVPASRVTEGIETTPFVEGGTALLRVTNLGPTSLRCQIQMEGMVPPPSKPERLPYSLRWRGNTDPVFELLPGASGVLEIARQAEANGESRENILRLFSAETADRFTVTSGFGASVVCEIRINSDPPLSDGGRRKYEITIGDDGGLAGFA